MSVVEWFAAIEKRKRRVCGATFATAAFLSSAAMVGVGAFTARLANAPVEVSLAVPLAVGPFFVAAVAYLWGRRRPVHLPRLLLEIDERLGLEARMSSLFHLTRTGKHPLFENRLSQDLERLCPEWRRAICVKKRSVIFGSLGGLLLAVALTVTLVPSLFSATTEAPSLVGKGSSSAPGVPGVAETGLGNPQTAIAPGEGTSSGKPGPGQTTAGRPQATLSDILAELRSNQTSSAEGASADSPIDGSAMEPGSEGSMSSLIERLEALQERLANDSSPLSQDEVETLQNSVASATPESRQRVEDSIASTDMNALRQTIEQLLSPEGGASPGDASTISRAGASMSPERPVSEGPSSRPDGGEPPQGASSSPGTSGGEGPPQGGPTDSEGDASIFDSGVGEVTPVHTSSVVGHSGGFTDYVTAGVPVESLPPTGDTTPLLLSPDKVDSVLSGRSLPESARQTIQDYFDRITKETP